MTRIFEALKKNRMTEPAVPFPPPAAAPLHPVAGGRPAARHPAELAPPATRTEPSLPRIETVMVPDLPEDLAREMITLRIGLEAALEERSTRVVMFLSSVGGEGTTTVAGQFATLLAGDERAHTLLVDFNGRRPAIASRMAAAAPARPESGGAHAPHPLAIGVPVGGQPETGPLAPAAARAFLTAVSAQYDWVVVDGPPVLEAAEASDLAPLVDGVVVVVRSGHTKRPVVSRAVDLLRKSGARILGTVLNRRRLEIPDFIYRRI
jgi:Mrp family chromosome partitioning ATPase